MNSNNVELTRLLKSSIFNEIDDNINIDNEEVKANTDINSIPLPPSIEYIVSLSEYGNRLRESEIIELEKNIYTLFLLFHFKMYIIDVYSETNENDAEQKKKKKYYHWKVSFLGCLSFLTIFVQIFCICTLTASYLYEWQSSAKKIDKNDRKNVNQVYIYSVIAGLTVLMCFILHKQRGIISLLWAYLSAMKSYKYHNIHQQQIQVNSNLRSQIQRR